MDQRTPKAIALISGGLDSTLAARAVREQGIEVLGLGFDHGFLSPPVLDRELPAHMLAMQKSAAAAGIPLEIIDVADDFIRTLLKPRHGYGSAVNPCIDCKILFLRKARECLEARGHDFLITGEVLGQRAMSQNAQTLRLIEKASGCEDLLLRPLSALCLQPIKAEREGLVDRSRLFAFTGRNRKPQIELAARWGIQDYPQPAGGCILTDQGFARRFRDFRQHLPEPPAITRAQIARLRLGRHFRLAAGGKVIVGRNERDNELLLQFRENLALARTAEHAGPVALVEENGDAAVKAFALAAVARYSDAPKDRPVRVAWEQDGIITEALCLPLGDAELAEVRI